LRLQAEPATTASRAPLPGVRATVQPTASRKNDASRTTMFRSGLTMRLFTWTPRSAVVRAARTDGSDRERAPPPPTCSRRACLTGGEVRNVVCNLGVSFHPANSTRPVRSCRDLAFDLLHSPWSFPILRPTWCSPIYIVKRSSPKRPRPSRCHRAGQASIERPARRTPASSLGGMRA